MSTVSTTAPNLLPYPALALPPAPRLDLTRLTLHAFPCLQSPLRRYVISVPSCHSFRLFLLSGSGLALLTQSLLPILAPPAPPAKPYALPVLGDWLFSGVDPFVSLPVPCALPPSRPGLLVDTVLMKLCVCARHCRLRLYLPL